MKKIKMKSHRGACKRLFLKKSGKIKYFSQGKRHGLQNKTRKRKRQLKQSKYLKSSTIKVVKRIIPFL